MTNLIVSFPFRQANPGHFHSTRHLQQAISRLDRRSSAFTALVLIRAGETRRTLEYEEDKEGGRGGEKWKSNNNNKQNNLILQIIHCRVIVSNFLR